MPTCVMPRPSSKELLSIMLPVTMFTAMLPLTILWVTASRVIWEQGLPVMKNPTIPIYTSIITSLNRSVIEFGA